MKPLLVDLGRGPSLAPLILFLLLATATLASGLGLKDPWPADEPRFALIAKDMVTTGQWLIPHRAGDLYADKPPIFIWSIAVSYLLTGSMQFAHLLPNLLAGLATLLLIFDLGRRLWNPRVGLYAATLLLLSFQFTAQAKRAQIDGMVCFWTTLGMYGLLRHVLLGPSWRWYVAGFFAMGLGVITKGVGFLPILMLIPYAYARRQQWPGLFDTQGASHLGRRWALGPLALLGAIALWLGPMLVLVAVSNDPELAAYRDNILWQQTAERYAAAPGHIEPFWFFLKEIPFDWAPLTLFLPWLLPMWFRQLQARDSRILLLLGWVVLVIAFFSFSAGKRDQYILPALPALALACAPCLEIIWQRRGAQIMGFGVSAVFAVLLLVVGVYLALQTPERVTELLPDLTRSPAQLLIALGGIALLGTLIARPRQGMIALAFCILLSWQAYGWWGYPISNDSPSGRQLMEAADSRLGANDELAVVYWREQLLLQASRPVIAFRRGRTDAPYPADPYQAAAWLERADNRYVLIPESALAPCFIRVRAEPGIEWRDDLWFLANRDALTPACRGLDEFHDWRRPW